jgi:transposase-like protein
MEKTSHADSGLMQRVVAEQQAARRVDRRVRYSEQLRRDIVSFVKTQRLSAEAGGKRLGLSKSAVRSWMEQRSHNKAQGRRPLLQQVEVVADVQPAPTDVMRLLFPTGAHVTLTMCQLRQLLGGQS